MSCCGHCRNLPPRPELQDMLRLRQLLRVESLEDRRTAQTQPASYFKQEQVLTGCCAELSGTMPLMKSSTIDVACEVILSHVLGLAWQQLVGKYGFPCNAAGRVVTWILLSSALRQAWRHRIELRF